MKQNKQKTLEINADLQDAQSANASLIAIEGHVNSISQVLRE